MYFFFNGSFLSEQEAKLSILDLGLIRGFGVFDYLRTYQGKPFHLEEHLQRLRYSARSIGLSLPYTFDEIKEILDKLIKQNGPGEYSLKLILTGGVSPDQLLPSGQVSFIAYAYPLTLYPAKHFIEGIKVITTSHKRCLPDCKTTQYLPAILSLQEGRKKGALESLYLNENQEILEATTSNFFAFKQGTLITPPENEILLGITREVILRLCQNHFPIEIRPISKKEIFDLDEAFITSSNKEVMPVTHIDDHLIKKEGVGPLTQRVMNLFSDYTSNQIWAPLPIPRYL
ncbi:MAG: aminotransferase class IV [Verrucomicrobia bacterium]|nr:aminotransferase class IV [Verrucomicrobiota bacterium]